MVFTAYRVNPTSSIDTYSDIFFVSAHSGKKKDKDIKGFQAFAYTGNPKIN